MRRRSSSQLEPLRWSIRPDADISHEDLDQIVDSALAELSEGTAEDFIKSLGSIGKAIAPVLQRAAPGIAQGAASGASVGGPWGALIGAGVGLGKGVAGSQRKPAGTLAPAASPVAAPAGSPATSTLPTGPAAAATLLGLFQNPAVQRALMSQVAGALGSPAVTTASGTDVPRAAINGLLAQLIANASESLDESQSIDEQAYLQDESGEYLVDPASPEQQGALVLARLQPDRESLPDSESSESDETAEWTMEALGDPESDEWVEFEDSGETASFY